MVKLALWLGTPSLVTFLASPSSSVRIINTLIIFALSIVLLLFGIGPQPRGRKSE